MKKITKTFEVYSYDELDQEIKDKIINDEVALILNFDYSDQSKQVKKAIDKAEEMLTPWFAGSYVWDYAKDEVLENIRDREYLKDGDIFNN